MLSWIYANKLIDAIGSHLLSVYLNGEDSFISVFVPVVLTDKLLHYETLQQRH